VWGRIYLLRFVDGGVNALLYAMPSGVSGMAAVVGGPLRSVSWRSTVTVVRFHDVYTRLYRREGNRIDTAVSVTGTTFRRFQNGPSVACWLV